MDKSAFRITALAHEFDRSGFDCEVLEMNEYLQKYAKQNDDNRLTRTRVALEDSTRKIVGYYTTGLAQVHFEEIPARGLPKNYSFTVGLLAQLAVDKSCKGRGIGRLMLYEALARFRQTESLQYLR